MASICCSGTLKRNNLINAPPNGTFDERMSECSGTQCKQSVDQMNWLIKTKSNKINNLPQMQYFQKKKHTNTQIEEKKRLNCSVHLFYCTGFAPYFVWNVLLWRRSCLFTFTGLSFFWWCFNYIAYCFFFVICRFFSVFPCIDTSYRGSLTVYTKETTKKQPQIARELWTRL